VDVEEEVEEEVREFVMDLASTGTELEACRIVLTTL